MALVSFIFFKSYFYFIFHWLIDFLGFIEKVFFVKYSRYNEEYQKEVILLYLICVNIGELSSGILVLITNKKLNFYKLKEITPINKNNLKLIYNDFSKKKNKYKLILLASIFDFIARGIDLFFLLIFDKIILKQYQIKWTISVDILSRIFFCRLILKINLYNHHKFSIILCSIGFFIMTIFAFYSIFNGNDFKYNKLNSCIYIIFLISQKIFFSLGDIISKILLTDKFLLPHFLMFYKSLICFFIFLVLVPILFFSSILNFNNFEKLFEAGDLRLHIFLKILLIILGFFACFCIYQIIYIFTPIHVGFINVVSAIFEIIQFSIIEYRKGDLIYLIFYIICLIVIGFGTLVFTEIIIVNKWGLNENTQSGFLLKEQLDKITPDSTIDLNDIIDNTEEKNEEDLSINNTEYLNSTNNIAK